MPLRRLPQLGINLDGHGSLYNQIYRALHQCIASERLKPGDRLPSTRSLASDLNVSRTSTQMAFDQLMAEGYLTSVTGIGTFISTQLEQVKVSPIRTNPVAINWSKYAKYAAKNKISTLTLPDREGEFDFRIGFPDSSLFPTSDWRRASRFAFDTVLLQNLNEMNAQGSKILRGQISDYLSRSRGIDCVPDRVIITSGTTHSLHLLSRALCNPDDDVLIENPGFHIARDIFQSEQLKVRTLPVDDHGIEIEKVGRLNIDRLKMIYLTPSHQFPLGSVLSASRRQAIVELASQRNAFVIEDDYDGEFRYSGTPLKTLYATDQADRVVYLGTFSKSLTPTLRLGYMVVPESMVVNLVAVRGLSGGFNSVFDQHAMAYLISEGYYERHIRRMKLVYSKRLKVLLRAVDKHLRNTKLLTGANAGLHVTLWLNALAKKHELDLLLAFKEQGLLLDLVNRFYIKSPARIGLALGYGLISEANIEAGIIAVKNAISGLTGSADRY